MKEIGRTNEGNVIVEMTDAEARAFELLRMAAEDRLPCILNQSYPMNGNVELEPVLQAIRMWVIAKFKIQELQEYLSDIEGLLRSK